MQKWRAKLAMLLPPSLPRGTAATESGLHFVFRVIRGMPLNRVAILSVGIPLVFLVALIVFRGHLEPVLPTAPQPVETGLASSIPSLSHVIGIASVIDGDTIVIHGTHIRLNGIDAPESGQFCEASGQRYLCGHRAAFALSDLLGSTTVDCQDLGRDRYGRIIGRCMAGSIDIQQWMVRQGWAIAYRKYSQEYITNEEQARLAKLGIWAGTFVKPEEWRRQKQKITHGQSETK